MLRKFLWNRYTAVSLAFVAWILFLDEYRWWDQRKEMHNLEVLRRQKEYYDSSIRTMTQEKEALESDTLLLERLAREKYRMYKPGETVLWFPDSTEWNP